MKPDPSPQSRAVRTYRARLRAEGMARFEVLGLERDRELVRRLARRLAEGGPAGVRLRNDLEQTVGDSLETRGGIIAALRRSPLVGSGVIFERDRSPGRKIDL